MSNPKREDETFEEDVPRCPNCGTMNHDFLEQHMPVKDEGRYPFNCPGCDWKGNVDCFKVIKFHVHD